MYLFHSLSKTLQLVLGLALVMAFALSTVPRCRAIEAFVSDARQILTSDELTFSCHQTQTAKSRPPLDAKQPQYKTDASCKCDLLTFFAFFLPNVDTQAWIRFQPSSTRLFDFFIKSLKSEFKLEPPVPHPKFY